MPINVQIVGNWLDETTILNVDEQVMPMLPVDPMAAKQVQLPLESRLRPLYEKAGFADAFCVDLPQTGSQDPEALARYLFEQQPRWIGRLLKLRDLLVSPLGIRRSSDFKASVG